MPITHRPDRGGTGRVRVAFHSATVNSIESTAATCWFSLHAR